MKEKQLIHYLISKLPGIDERKLEYMLWLIDSSSYYKTGKPVTSFKYVKRDYGYGVSR